MEAMQLQQVVVVGNELALAWGDDVETYIPLEKLRRACPCANCQGEPDALGNVLRPTVSYGANAFQLQRLETVGGYALQCFWADGHQTGIYTFRYLRDLG